MSEPIVPPPTATLSGSVSSVPQAGAGPLNRPLKEIEKLFMAMATHKASDLHLKAGLRPVFRISTVLNEVGNTVLSPEASKRIIWDIMSEPQREKFEREGGADFAYSLEGAGRFRINVFKDRGTVATAARRVHSEIPNFDDLHLPEGIRKVPTIKQGFVIVAGPTGQGKSTTLASVLQHINETRKVHIITIEDPIEYLFKDVKSFVNQREIGIDVLDFHMALRHVVRQNPDVILVGEMRDSTSVDAALMAAETGHLVFGTIHASSSAQTIGRILDLFPPERHEGIRQLLVFNLRAVICQKLLPSSKEGVRMVPAVEIMFCNPSVQKLLKDKEDSKLADVVRGGAEEGMQDFNQALVKLVNEGYVTKKVAMMFSPNAEQLKMNLQGIYIGDEHKILG